MKQLTEAQYQEKIATGLTLTALATGKISLNALATIRAAPVNRHYAELSRRIINGSVVVSG